MIMQSGMARVHHPSQDHYRAEIDKRKQHLQQQHLQQQHLQQQQQHQYRHQQQHQQQRQHHNYHQVHSPPMKYSSTSNPPHRSFWVEQDQGNSSATTTSNFDNDNNNIPYPISDGGRLGAPAPNNGSSYQNQDALQQLQNNLRMVLKQQQQQNPQKKLQLHHLPQGMVSMSGSEDSHKDAAVNCNTRIQHGEGQCNSDAPPNAFQTKMLSHYLISSGDSRAPSCTEERTNTNIINGKNSSNNSVSKQRERRYKLTPNSYSSQFPSASPSINQTSSGLFALGDEVQPLSSTSQQKTVRRPSSPSLSSNALLGNWSEELTAEEAANDIFMDNIFHAELKLSRGNKSTDNDSKPQPPSTKSDSNQPRQFYPCSKDDESVEVRYRVLSQWLLIFVQKNMFMLDLNPSFSLRNTHSSNANLLRNCRRHQHMLSRRSK